MCMLKRSTEVPTAHSYLSFRKDFNMLTFRDNKGQGLVEYALILVLVAVVVIVILALLGPAIGNVFSNIVNAI
jgi:pilus assembly protein Flp/PilA